MESAERIRSEAELGSADIVMFYVIFLDHGRGGRESLIVWQEVQGCADFDFHIDAHSYKSNIGMRLEVKSVPSVDVLCTRPFHGMLLFLFGRVSQDFALIQTLGDASDSVTAVSWRGQVLAAAGDDKKLRIYHEARGGLGCLTGRLGYSRLL